MTPEVGKINNFVYNAGMVKKERRKICDICGGSGQQSFFQGVSRFLLSTKECDACAGTGLQLDSIADNATNSVATDNKKKSKKKK